MTACLVLHSCACGRCDGISFTNRDQSGMQHNITTSMPSRDSLVGEAPTDCR